LAAETPSAKNAERPAHCAPVVLFGWRLGQRFDVEFALEPQVCNTDRPAGDWLLAALLEAAA
jgi:hypothetical protein